MDRFTAIINALNEAHVQFLVIGVWGINHYARSGGTLFTTEDRDLFMPLDPANLFRAWKVCDEQKLELRAGNDPLDRPRDFTLAQRVVEYRALTSAFGEEGLHIDLSFVMGGFTFDEVWSRRRTFMVDGVTVPVARLTDIVQSKANAGRPKDLLFLATHEEALRFMPKD